MQRLPELGVLPHAIAIAADRHQMAVMDEAIVQSVDPTGALSMIAVSTEIASEWSFQGNSLSQCTGAPKLFADVSTTEQIGLVVRQEPYTFNFVDFNPTDLRHWNLEQQGGVRDAFDTWNRTSRSYGLGITFREFTDAEKVAASQPGGTQPDIALWKNNTLTAVAGYVATNTAARPLVNRRALGGTNFYSTDQKKLSSRLGYFKASLHEIGHAFGLAHPTATTANPDGAPSMKSSIKGATVMNPMGGLDDSQPYNKKKDDYPGLVPMAPSACDIEAVKNAILK